MDSGMEDFTDDIELTAQIAKDIEGKTDEELFALFKTYASPNIITDVNNKIEALADEAEEISAEDRVAHSKDIILKLMPIMILNLKFGDNNSKSAYYYKSLNKILGYCYTYLNRPNFRLIRKHEIILLKLVKEVLTEVSSESNEYYRQVGLPEIISPETLQKLIKYNVIAGKLQICGRITTHVHNLPDIDKNALTVLDLEDPLSNYLDEDILKNFTGKGPEKAPKKKILEEYEDDEAIHKLLEPRPDLVQKLMDDKEKLQDEITKLKVEITEEKAKVADAENQARYKQALEIIHKLPRSFYTGIEDAIKNPPHPATPPPEYAKPEQTETKQEEPHVDVPLFEVSLSTHKKAEDENVDPEDPKKPEPEAPKEPEAKPSEEPKKEAEEKKPDSEAPAS